MFKGTEELLTGISQNLFKNLITLCLKELQNYWLVFTNEKGFLKINCRKTRKHKFPRRSKF